jgi:GH18 family chitinase
MSPFEDGLYNDCYWQRPAGDSDQPAGTGVWKWRNLLSQGVLVADSSLGDGMYVGGGDWNYRFDNETVSPYVWSNTTAEWIQYDDPVTISYKREFAYQQGLQGMMVWEIEYDDDQGTLLSYMA